MAQEQVISVTPAFFGRSKHAALHAMTAEQFLGHMDRKKVQQQQQQDNVFIAQVSNYLWDEARDWYEKILPINQTEYERIITDWGEFKRAFRREYFEITTTRDTQLNWINIRQQQGEVLPNFLNRLAASITESTQLYIDETITNAQRQHPDAKDQGTQAPLHQFILGGDANIAALRDYLTQEYAPWILQRFAQANCRDQFTQVAATGLKDKWLKHSVRELAQDSTSITDLMWKVRNKAKCIDVDPNGKKGSVNAVTDQDKSDQSQAQKGQVNAVNSNKGKGGKKGKKGKKNNGQSQQKEREEDAGQKKEGNSKCPLCSEAHSIQNCPDLERCRLVNQTLRQESLN